MHVALILNTWISQIHIALTETYFIAAAVTFAVVASQKVLLLCDFATFSQPSGKKNRPCNISKKVDPHRSGDTTSKTGSLESVLRLMDGHDDVIKWKHFPRYWTFVRGIHRSPVNSSHKGQ